MSTGNEKARLNGRAFRGFALCSLGTHLYKNDYFLPPDSRRNKASRGMRCNTQMTHRNAPPKRRNPTPEISEVLAHQHGDKATVPLLVRVEIDLRIAVLAVEGACLLVEGVSLQTNARMARAGDGSFSVTQQS